MSAQVDHEENIHVLFDSIIYHHTDYSNVQDTFTKSKKMVVDVDKTIKGW